MTKREELEALAARVEVATGADRWIDAEVAEVLGVGAHYNRGSKWAVTGSVDAAMELIPPGWGYGLDYHSARTGMRFILGSPDRAPRFVRGEALTFPRAVTAASLRARALLSGEG